MCDNKTKNLSDEQLDKVSGGHFYPDGYPDGYPDDLLGSDPDDLLVSDDSIPIPWWLKSSHKIANPEGFNSDPPEGEGPAETGESPW